MFKEILSAISDSPTWFKILMVFFIVLGIASSVYVISECGFFNALMLGKSGFFVAYTGMCNH